MVLNGDECGVGSVGIHAVSSLYDLTLHLRELYQSREALLAFMVAKEEGWNLGPISCVVMCKELWIFKV
jgi:hypothetical protein